MRILVTGGRDYDNMFQMYEALHKLKPTLIIHGDAKGADSMAQRWAEENGVETLVFPANWRKHGRRAGPIRNRKMLTESDPDIVLAFPGGVGTNHMISTAVSEEYVVLKVQ